MAGELRRYWAFAATLALGTGLGDSHPPVQEIADTLSTRLPCLQVTLGDHPGAPLRELLGADGGRREYRHEGNGMTGTRLRVAQVITRFMAGAGGVALSGALALDPEHYEVVFIAGEGDDDLVAKARDGRPRGRADAAPAQRDRPRGRPPGPRRPPGLPARASMSSIRTAPRRARSAAWPRTGWRSAGSCTPSTASRSISSSPGRAGRPTSRSSGRLGRYTDVFLAVGPAVAAEAITRRIAPPERVRTIGVGVAKAPNAPGAHERAKARRVLGVPPGMRVVGTVGRLAFQKAPEDFVRALAGLGRSDVFGVWIGDGPLRAKIERLAQKHGLSGRMLFTGERADVEVLLPGLDVFAMASRYEGLPCAIVEAMGAGLPVVATAVNAVPDVVIAGETGLLVPPGTPDTARPGHRLPDRQSRRGRQARRGGPGPARRGTVAGCARHRAQRGLPGA